MTFNNQDFNKLLDENEFAYTQNNSVYQVRFDDLLIDQVVLIKKNPLSFYGENILIKSSVFKYTNIIHSSFYSNSEINDCTFIGCDLSRTIFNGTLSNNIFVNCILSEFEIENSKITNCIFIDCDFSAANIYSNEIEYSHFIKNVNLDKFMSEENSEKSVFRVD